MKGILVAVSPEGIIGKDNSIPWHYSADLKRFKRLTLGKTVIMGRRTWESLPVKPLPDRRNIVITQSSLDDVEYFSSIDDALATCEGDVWFIGGAGIYQEALGKADIIDMTLVPDNVSGEGCVRFPTIGNEWDAGPIEALETDGNLRHQTYTRRV
ncbi:MAG: dihydrofolate reductase [Candidatus Poseidoniia archaeon]|jgi:dihydrofolate reductase|nr:dihydrofolate reductase [Candidatus Poseidoniia archaeon]MDP6441557.1 dihydrofolate reductase [Candidatus Poseidoniia archaeon]MDP6591560.1 dihydrofolate reductase [Candidatus Poseidoniia archaeon]MDP7096077.1 dihydrofolate reductase [Candidatus Poseidoniia archaeon]MDP7187252.1 dihydrofolate reductase [Candidatus Poseidoniia archaeon]|tara:strand:+ start:140 stop:604 length:465 start_codon:yes stop_codon:yes gene_type:complete